MNQPSVIVGSVGVALLLLAFFLNLFKVVSSESKVYAWLNIVGAFVSCYASLLIDYVPFVVLEGVWGIVAVIGLIRNRRGGGGEQEA